MTMLRTISAFSHELRSIIDRVVNPRCGLIDALYEEPPSKAALGIRLVHATLTPPTYFLRNAPCQVKTAERGTGASFARQAACWSAIGEAIERYAGSLYWPDQLTFASADALGARALRLDRLIRCARPGVMAFDPRTDRSWVKGTDLVSGTDVLVPAAMTYLGYKGAAENEMIVQNDSTGLACGSSLESASLRALCELIERDLFAATWLLKRSPPELEWGAAIERLDVPVRHALMSDRLSVRLFYLGNSFGVHAVLCVVAAPEGYGVVSAAASPSIVQASEKAVCEGLYSWAASQGVRERPCDKSKLNKPSDHLLYYLDPERFALVLALVSSSEKIAVTKLLGIETPNLVPSDVALAMRYAGLSAAVVEVTTPDVAALQMHVVRAVVPGLQPLVFGSACTEVPDGRRLDDWRKRWGLTSTTINPEPHPFP